MTADTDHGPAIREKLDLNSEQFESLFGALNDWNGNAVAQDLERRFDLTADIEAGYGLWEALEKHGILTAAEVVWLED